MREIYNDHNSVICTERKFSVLFSCFSVDSMLGLVLVLVPVPSGSLTIRRCGDLPPRRVCPKELVLYGRK